MKKFLSFLFIFFLFLSASSAEYSPKKLPNNFKPECYKYYWKLDTSSLNIWETYYLDTNRWNIVLTQNSEIIPNKLSNQKDWLYYDFSIYIENQLVDEFELDYRALKDSNKKTFYEIIVNSNEITDKEIILDFKDKWVEENSSSFVFDYTASYYYPEFYVSNDRVNFNKVSENDITEFSFKYLKIIFKLKSKIEAWPNFSEKIQISELNFLQNKNAFLFTPFYNTPIEIYSSNDCKEYIDVSANPYNNYSISNNTRTISLNLWENPNYNVFSQKDDDNDWVENDFDNCKNIYNPKQVDSNADWVWDLCSDDDRDWIIWHKDNCIYISNRDQLDINRNGVWDVCEFDKDSDWIFDSIDNCITKANPDQRDDDNDRIWNMCDNCSLYNPRQLDTNSNWIWDTCENAEKNIIENDDDKDWIINYKDNCKLVSNTNQLDTDSDWIWDVCDNCINIQNSKQIDKNENGVWDMCEDSDNDSIIWYMDNCINIANSNQEDSDNDWVWNVCEDDDKDNIVFSLDNCPYSYNPEQGDIDNDGIWDKCDNDDNRFIESNKAFFVALLVFLVASFSIWIYFMVKKLK